MSTKAETQNLIKAYALMFGSKTMNADLKTQQKFHNKFYYLLNKLETKYSGKINQNDIDELKSRGENYWKNKAFKGPGVDW